MSDIIVERLVEYSDQDAAGIGRLMPFLRDSLSDEPMGEELLTNIIESPYHDQLVARLDGIIVGVATMNLLMGPGAKGEGYLEDFVTDGAFRRQGIGEKVWKGMLDWCQERDVNLGFTSRPDREAAQSFYANHDAEVRETTVFHVQVRES